jgi:hypothetical protein
MNSAERVLAIYDMLIQQQGDGQMVTIWATVFEVDPATPELDDHITACTVALRSEIQLTHSLLTKHGVPPDIRGPGLDRLTKIARPGYFHTNWHSLRGNVLPPENRVSLAWATWALRDEDESEVAAADRQVLVEELANFEAKLNDVPMSDYMRNFIQRQIETIRRALRIYGVSGAKPLQDALRRVVGDLKVEDAKIKAEYEAATPAAKSAMATATTLIVKAAKFADQGSKLKKGAEDIGALAGTVQEHLGSIAGAIKPFLSLFASGNGP